MRSLKRLRLTITGYDPHWDGDALRVVDDRFIDDFKRSKRKIASFRKTLKKLVLALPDDLVVEFGTEDGGDYLRKESDGTYEMEAQFVRSTFEEFRMIRWGMNLCRFFPV